MGSGGNVGEQRCSSYIPSINWQHQRPESPSHHATMRPKVGKQLAEPLAKRMKGTMITWYSSPFLSYLLSTSMI